MLIKINTNNPKKCLKYMIVVSPYFELPIIYLMSKAGIGGGFYTMIGNIAAIMRYVFSFYYMLKFFKHIMSEGLLCKRITYATFVFFGIIAVVTTLNKSGDLHWFISLFNYVGFSCVCSYLISKSKREFVTGIWLLFGFISFLGCMTYFIFPSGFFIQGYTKIYLLGSKNGFGLYFCLFVILVLLRYEIIGIKAKKTIYIIVGLFLLVAYLLESTNSVICIFLLLLYILAENYGKVLRKFLNGKIIFWGLAVLFYLLIINNTFISEIIGEIGEDLTYSIRTMLWAQAKGMIAEHPVIGSGKDLSFIINQYVSVPQAHNFFLDYAAKYGLIPITLFVGYFLYQIHCLARIREKRISRTLIVGNGVFLLHSMFDDISFFFFILLFALMECYEKDSIYMSGFIDLRKEIDRHFPEVEHILDSTALGN